MSNGLIAFVVFSSALAGQPGPAQPPSSTEPIRIGMVRSFFGDGEKLTLSELVSDRKKLAVISKLFEDFVQEHSGLKGRLHVGGGYRRVARMVNNKQLDIGVLHGFEFAWVQRDFPALQPLLIAIYRDRNLTAHLVVRDDHNAKQVKDLKGTALALPAHSKGHCRLFLQRLCQGMGSATARSFFNVVERSRNVRTALDELVHGSVEAALVDGELLESYAQLKPGCFEKLRVLAQSEPFPATVLVHRPGHLDAKSLAAFRRGLLKASQTISGRDRMLLFKIGVFELPPADYDQQLAEVREAYPPPGVDAAANISFR